MCRNHVRRLTGEESGLWHRHIYRIFFYDAEPYTGKAHHPISNHPIDYAKSPIAQQRQTLFTALRQQRKLALRLGKVNNESDWTIAPRLTKKLVRHQKALAHLAGLDHLKDSGGELSLTSQQVDELIRLRDQWSALEAKDIMLGLKQKGVDTRIAIDMVSIALKQQAQTLLLVTGDSDFVPAAKLVRREGLEIILDPMGQQINDDLHEHIDGLNNGLQPSKHATD